MQRIWSSTPRDNSWLLAVSRSSPVPDLRSGKKSYQRHKLMRVTHVMRLGTQADLKITLQGMGFSGRLNTAFIERVNLTVRHGVAALARCTWATAKPAPQLLVHLEWWRAF